MKIPFEVQDPRQKDALILKIIADLLRIHGDFLQKVTLFEKTAETLKKKGDKGDSVQGPPGKDYVLTEKDKEDIATKAASRIDVPVVEKIIEKTVIRETPIVTEIRQEVMPDLALLEKIFEDVLKKKKLSSKDIDGLEQTLSALGNQIRQGYLHGGGVPSLSAGSNITLTPKTDGGFTISAAAGGFTFLTATGARDNSNTAFTFTQKPTYIIVNGQWIRENFGWTWNAGSLTATLEGPVGKTGDIFGFV